MEEELEDDGQSELARMQKANLGDSDLAEYAIKGNEKVRQTLPKCKLARIGFLCHRLLCHQHAHGVSVQEWDAVLGGGKVKGNVSIKAAGDSSSTKKKRKVIHENDGSVIRNKQEGGSKKKRKSSKKRK